MNAWNRIPLERVGAVILTDFHKDFDGIEERHPRTGRTPFEEMSLKHWQGLIAFYCQRLPYLERLSREEVAKELTRIEWKCRYRKEAEAAVPCKYGKARLYLAHSRP